MSYKNLGKKERDVGGEFEQIPLDTPVNIVLKKGLEVHYNTEESTVDIKPARNFYLNVEHKNLKGNFKGFNDETKETLSFQTEDGFRYSLNCQDIHEYQILK